MDIILGLLVGLAFLFLGGNWLVQGASRLAQSIGISPLIVGLTIVAIGTSAPELIVSVSAAIAGSSDIAIGNVVGSNIANLGLILGISALIYPVSVHVTMLRREIPIMLGVTIIAFGMFQDGTLSRIEGVLLVAGFLIFVAFMIYSSRQEQTLAHDITEEQNAAEPKTMRRSREFLRLGIGIVLLVLGAQLTVNNASILARNLGVDELVIGVTLVAVGTSLPELVTSVTAALHKESDIAIGNVVGSNIFNILGILGISALIQPIQVSPQSANVDSLVMVGFSLLALPFVLDRKLGRIEGGMFIVAYVGFTLYTIL